MEGTSPLGKFYNIIFRSPNLHARHKLGHGIMYWLVNSEVPAVMGPMDQGDLWTFSCEKLADADIDPVPLIRAATGIADLEVEIISRDERVAHQLLAKRYREGNVFLAGDACHLHPPFGGFGMNMGIGDAVDLGWKFSAVLSGWGGPALLDSYEIERRQVHQRVVDEAVINLAAGSRQYAVKDIERPDAQGEAARTAAGASILTGKRREFDSLGIVLGSCYDQSPVLVHDGTEARAIDALDFQQSARPGCRAPHLWVAEGKGPGASLFDLFNRHGFTLLVTHGPVERAAPIILAAEQLGVPLEIVAPETKGLHALYRNTFALIRPDQFVAWRGDDIAEAIAALDTIAGYSPRTNDQPMNPKLETA